MPETRLATVLIPTLAALALGLTQCDRKRAAARPSAAATEATASRVAADFNQDIRPLLSDRCFGCHGPDANKGRQAGLRLDTREGATATLKSGNRAIVPGDPTTSAMVARMHAPNPDDVMPPAKLNRPLTAAERDLLTRWIAAGAEYQPHWAFVPPRSHAPQSVTDSTWPRDDIDRFVLAKMSAQGLSPNPPADRASLLRRASFALTGLPPSPEQIDAFLADPAPDAYGRQIDALLASPAYGERLAQDWLDVARFADTYGYQTDSPCFVWPWRDWVIKAFNDNLPFDRFAAWQLAGDLVPEATQETRLATTFNRLHRLTQEGGSIEAEFRQENVSDRVHTFGTAFLGLTLECAKCHDHKYDPIPQSDYYSLASMFGQIDECGLYPYSISTTAPEPSMPLLEPGQMEELATLRARLEAADATYQKLAANRDTAFEAWLAATTDPVPTAPVARYALDRADAGKCANSVPNGKPASVSGGQIKPAGGGLEFDGDTVLLLDGIAGVTRHDPLTVSLRVFCPDHKDRAVILHSGPEMYSQAADASGFELLLENGKLRWSCIHLWPGCAASVETRDIFPTGRWVHLTVTYDGSSSAAGLHIHIDGQPATIATVRDHLDLPIVAGTFRVGARPRDDRGFAQGRLADLAIFRAALSPVEAAALAGAPMTAVYQAAKSGDAAARKRIKAFFLAHHDAELGAARQAATAARERLYDGFLAKLPRIMVMDETPYRKQFHVLSRGDYATPDLSKPVEPAAPAAVMPFAPDLPRNRLGLARWVTAPDNPLVARVAVNRFWAMCFGAGIVPTQENFGLQGDPPTHQEMLDTLAREFIDSGWDVKQLLKRIVTSATFQQASAASPEKLERDPKNQLLARGPAFRLSAEAIRDQALAASGLLVKRVGGPSVKPWQPPGLWSESGAAGGDYQPDTGEGLHRRSLYTFRKRTAPPPSLLTLDAGSREICQARRLVTNTPLQPLLLLNDPSFFECARALAVRCLTEVPGDDPAAQLARAFRRLTSRPPREREARVLLDLYQTQRAALAGDPAAAKSLCGKEDPALAALTLACSTLLAADACLTTR